MKVDSLIIELQGESFSKPINVKCWYLQINIKTYISYQMPNSHLEFDIAKEGTKSKWFYKFVSLPAI